MKDLLTKDNLILYGTLLILLVSIGIFNFNEDFTGNIVFNDQNSNKIKVEVFGPLPSNNLVTSITAPKSGGIIADDAEKEIQTSISKLEGKKEYRVKISATNPNYNIVKIKRIQGNNFKIENRDCNQNSCEVNIGGPTKSKGKVSYDIRVSTNRIKEEVVCDNNKVPLWNGINVAACWDENGYQNSCDNADKQKTADWWCQNKCGQEKSLSYETKKTRDIGTKYVPAGKVCTSCSVHFTKIECGSLEEELIEREKELSDLIEKDLEAALRFQPLDNTLRSGLRSNLQAHVEQRGEFEGEIEVLHMDDFEEEKSEFEFFLRKDNKRFKLYSSKELPVMLSGTRVRVKGLALGNKMALTSIEGNNLIKLIRAPDVPTGSQASENLGDQKTLVILTKINNLDAGITKEEAEKLIFSEEPMTIQSFYKDNSFGKVSFYGKVIGPFELPSESCDYDKILSNAVISAYPDISSSEYSRIIIFSPRTSCSRRIGGWGSIGKWPIILPNNKILRASISWIFTPGLNNRHNPQIPPGLYVTAHELGHNFGVDHSNRFSCPRKSDINDISLSECETLEYYGIGVMGHYLQQHLALHKSEIGWLTDRNTITVTESGIYELKPIELNSDGIQQIRLPVNQKPYFYSGHEGIYYSVEFRKYGNYLDQLDGNIKPTVIINLGKFDDRKNEKRAFTHLQAHTITSLLKPGNSYISRTNNYQIILEEINENYAKINIIRKETPSKQETGSATAPIGGNLPSVIGSSPAALFSQEPPAEGYNPYDSQFMTRLIQSVFLARYTGDNFIEIWLEVKNTGAETWTKENGFKLKWAGEDLSPWGVEVIELDPTDNIAKDQTKLFKFRIYKPNINSPSRLGPPCGGGISYHVGIFNFEFRMYNEDLGKFFGPTFKRDICV